MAQTDIERLTRDVAQIQAEQRVEIIRREAAAGIARAEKELGRIANIQDRIPTIERQSVWERGGGFRIGASFRPAFGAFRRVDPDGNVTAALLDFSGQIGAEVVLHSGAVGAFGNFRQFNMAGARGLAIATGESVLPSIQAIELRETRVGPAVRLAAQFTGAQFGRNMAVYAGFDAEAAAAFTFTSSRVEANHYIGSVQLNGAGGSISVMS